MSRPFKQKFIGSVPDVTYFKPRAIRLSDLEEVVLTYEEFEAVRLSDVEGLNQTPAAGMMKIHQSTFHRTLDRARKKVAEALVIGKAIRIEGGHYRFVGQGTFAPGRGQGPRRKRRGHQGKWI